MIIAMLAAAAAAMQPSRNAPDIDDAAFRNAIIAMHDAERAQVGAPPLAWSPALARAADQWASHLAQIDDLVHWGESGEADNGQGENLWMGTRGAYRLPQMVGGWSEEKKPLARMASWEDDYEKVGHYTQMVWRDTRKVGCAVRSNRSNDILVCRYWPAGNVMGQDPNGEETEPMQIASID